MGRSGARPPVEPGRHVADNYEVLGYPPAAPAREARYTRYVDGRRLLRTHMTAAVPGALRRSSGPATADPTSSWRAPASSTAATWSTGCTSASRTSSTCGASGAASRSPRPRPGRDDRPRRLGDPARGAAPGACPRRTRTRPRAARWRSTIGGELGGAPRVRPRRDARARAGGLDPGELVGARPGPRPRPRAHAAEGRHRHPPAPLRRSAGRAGRCSTSSPTGR